MRILAIAEAIGPLAAAHAATALARGAVAAGCPAGNLAAVPLAEAGPGFGEVWAALEGQPIPPLPPLAQRCDTAVRQIELAARDKGEHIAILEARKQYAWYLKGVPHAGYYKEQIVRMNTLEDMYRITEGIRRDLI